MWKILVYCAYLAVASIVSWAFCAVARSCKYLLLLRISSNIFRNTYDPHELGRGQRSFYSLLMFPRTRRIHLNLFENHLNALLCSAF